MSDLAPELLAMLVCPRCRGALTDEASSLRCDACVVRYPVSDGIPMLRPQDAQPLGEPAAG